MPHYKAPDNSVHFIEQEFIYLLPVGSIEITEQEVAELLAPPALPIPSVVTMRQARLALLARGLLDDITAAINGLPSPQKEAATIEWEYSAEVHRDKALVQLLAPALGLSDTDLDDLFQEAAAL